MNIDFSKYLRIPFSELKCFELISHVYINELGIDIGDYRSPGYAKKWVEVTGGLHAWKRGDLIQFSPPKGHHQQHVGLFVEQGKMFHTIKGDKSRTDRIEAYIKASGGKLMGVYRWR